MNLAIRIHGREEDLPDYLKGKVIECDNVLRNSQTYPSIVLEGNKIPQEKPPQVREDRLR